MQHLKICAGWASSSEEPTTAALRAMTRVENRFLMISYDNDGIAWGSRGLNVFAIRAGRLILLGAMDKYQPNHPVDEAGVPAEDVFFDFGRAARGESAD